MRAVSRRPALLPDAAAGRTRCGAAMRVGILVTAQDRQMASPAKGSSQVRSRCALRRRSKFGLAQASFRLFMIG